MWIKNRTENGEKEEAKKQNNSQRDREKKKA